MARLLDGKKISEMRLNKLHERIKKRISLGFDRPELAVILVGNDPASLCYVKNKQIACERVGIVSRYINLDKNVKQHELLQQIENLNNNAKVHGILIQLPLPAHIDTFAVINEVAINKDVDGFHPENIGRLAAGSPRFTACTTLGIMCLLKETGESFIGKDVTIVGSSIIVGMPTALALSHAGCTVTICQDTTKDLCAKIRKADILISAVGQPGLIDGKDIKMGSIVIDVGSTKMEDGHFVGDVKFDSAEKRANWITPVPGGVGPMTVVSLLENTLLAAEFNQDIS